MKLYSLVPEWQVSQWFNQDKALKLTDLRGRVVLLHAFQMLCPGCVSHGLPQAERIHRHFPAEQLTVVGLHTVFEHHQAMGPIALEAFLHEYRISHPIAVDQAVAGQDIPAPMRRYGLRGTPSVMLIDRAGHLRLHQFGQVDDLSLGSLIGQLMAESDQARMRQADAHSTAGLSPSGCSAEGCALP